MLVDKVVRRHSMGPEGVGVSGNIVLRDGYRIVNGYLRFDRPLTVRWWVGGPLKV